MNNSAKQSPNIASYPGHMEYLFEQNNKTYSSAAGDEVVFAPGQNVKFII